MPEIVSGAEYATFINTSRCEPSNQDEVVQLNPMGVGRTPRGNATLTRVSGDSAYA
jgi:hypothetical protein